MFEYLDQYPEPVVIVETGCTRKPGNWAGDGQSTVLFDQYVLSRKDGSQVHSVDIDPEAVRICKTLVSDNVSVNVGDSVAYLHKFARSNSHVHLFYLDSFDVDWNYWFPSAAHHLKELVAIQPILKSDTLVVVDDCMLSGNLLPTEPANYQVIGTPQVGGKGRLVAEYANQVGAKPMFLEYQVGWTGF
jgi:predicted O-methyltransferase YrrM